MPVLNWPTREADFQVARGIPYRLLETARGAQGGAGESGNLLIHGDNLDALKALLPYYAGQVKCIFIDPPYNTRSRISEHYDDNLEHSQWLAMMHPRLLLLRELLAEDGSIWAIIDDDEGHYLKVLMDEIFGRENFVANVVWQKRTSPDARLRLGAAQDYILVYGEDGESIKFNKLELSDEQKKQYKNPDKDERGGWVSVDLTGQTGHATPEQYYEIETPTGIKYRPPEGRCWAIAKSTIEKLVAENRIWFGKDGNSRPRLKQFLYEKEGTTAWSWWPNSEVGHNQEAKKEINTLFGAENGFATPKPERLIQRVLQLATNEGDLVLDSFLGSGTTAAVAHKMGRRWIGIELGEHAVTHCAPRLKAVVEGEQGGISKAVNWQGGGSFQFCKLGEVAFTPDGKINPKIRFPVLAAHIWFTETHRILGSRAKKPFLGVHDGKGYALLYNGILSDRSVGGGNVLTQKTLASVRRASGGFEGPLVIYAAANRLGEQSLERERITFKQTPYEIKAH